MNVPAGEGLLAGRYELAELLGRGAMGAVYAGHDRVLGREVAIKVLGTTGAPPEAVARFRREGQYLAGLSHPNVVTVFDFGSDSDRSWLVMERLPGPTLAQLVATHGPMPVAQVAQVGQECAAALTAAHAAGVIHRDVKPANVMLAADGRCKLLDLGIARLADATATSAALTQTGSILGTVAYLAPEVFAGEAVTAAADMYALGCVLYTLLTGAPPFTTDAPAATMAQHVTAAIPHPSTTRPDVPAALDGLVVDLLAKAPQQRPTAVQSLQRLGDLPASPAAAAVATTAALPAADLIAALRPAEPRAPGRRSRHGVRSRPRWLALALMVVLLVTALVAATRRSSSDAPSAAAHASGTALPRTATTSSPSATPAERKTPSRPTPPSPAALLRRAIAGAVDTGQVTNQAAADELTHRADDLIKAIEANSPDLVHKIDDFRRHVRDLARQGKLTSAGESTIASAVRQVTAQLGLQAGDSSTGEGD